MPFSDWFNILKLAQCKQTDWTMQPELLHLILYRQLLSIFLISAKPWDGKRLRYKVCKSRYDCRFWAYSDTSDTPLLCRLFARSATERTGHKSACVHGPTCLPVCNYGRDRGTLCKVHRMYVYFHTDFLHHTCACTPCPLPCLLLMGFYMSFVKYLGTDIQK